MNGPQERISRLHGEGPEVTEWDQQTFLRLVSTQLTPAQKDQVRHPLQSYPQQDAVLAVHWHPEFIPLELILERVNATFPNHRSQLIIPTQHNELMTLGPYAGVEIDCYSPEFDLKVQLLAHFAAPRIERAAAFRAMLARTFQYRATQLHELIDSILEPAMEDRVQKAADRTGASPELVHFVRVQVGKIRQLIERNASVTRPDMLKNKLLRNFFNALYDRYDPAVLHHAQLFLLAVKKIVKAEFNPSHFHRTHEVIEEVRGLGGCLVVPHPEQFWPILLADYDVDGIEVWNPQSQQYTEFLIHVVVRQNQARRNGDRPLLIFMGDDTHFGEKVVEPDRQDPEKAGRELGVQPAWDHISIAPKLRLAKADRSSLIDEYKQRLG
ncbi:MAG: hypothetical protein JXB13_10585 [Phycisphaerae bacterium]|nr:hypothetical protein [Phycisphaerae bacterium]